MPTTLLFTNFRTSYFQSLMGWLLCFVQTKRQYPDQPSNSAVRQTWTSCYLVVAGRGKTTRKTIETAQLVKKGGVDLILQKLHKAYTINKNKKLGNDLADFLDYTWKNEVNIDHFISKFHTGLDKIL